MLVPGETGIVCSNTSLFVSDSIFKLISMELCAGEMKQPRFCEGKIKSCLNRHCDLCDLCQYMSSIVIRQAIKLIS